MAPQTAFAAPAAVAAASAFAGAATSVRPAARPAAATTMLYGKPRPVQIIPSVLPADWANMGAECKRLEDAGVDRIQVRVADSSQAGAFVGAVSYTPRCR